MGKTIIYISMTLDGFVAGKDDDLSWLMPYASVDYGYNDFYKGIGAIILGKRTCDHIVANWDWPYSNVPVFVLSDEPLKNKPSEGEIHAVNGVIEDVLEQAKQKTDKNIWIGGGAHVVQDFLRQDLADELIITVVPVLLGEGISLFGDINRTNLELIHVDEYDSGLVQLRYKV
ncbi:MAG TPA: dihydrofolate reductase family protein [Patescibacteria group bacterium]|nr:dihydrofolate reductase family protein [Patescibacteria group bacterium]